LQVFDKNGGFKFQFGVAGKEEGLLYYPRKVAVIRESGKFVVCDRGNERSRLQTFTKNGHFIRKIAIRSVGQETILVREREKRRENKKGEGRKQKLAQD